MTHAIACSVLVPVYNEEQYIEGSVEAMRRQRFDGELEFLFADGGSTDRTREILERIAERDPRIRIFDNPSRSVSSGLNVALRHARGRWALRMDAHTVYPDDYASLGVRRLEAGGTRWVSGPQIPVGDGRVSRAVAAALSGTLGRGGSRKWGAAAPTDISGTEEYELDTGVFAGVWERATLLEYEGWDERWPRNSDSEMAARFLANGERLVCVPAMGARYVPRDSLSGLWRQYRGYGRYRARTSRRHPHSMRASHLLAPALVLDAGFATIAPAAIRRIARVGLGLYAVVLLTSTRRAYRTTRSAGDTALVAVVLATMHAAHGIGQIEGWLSDGPPLAAVARIVGVPVAASTTVDAVFSPSLRSAA